MTADDFRKLALALPDAVESSHMGHPDFRVERRLFATLGAPDPDWAMVKLTPDEQEAFLQIDSQGLRPVPGGWSRGGATHVRLATARPEVVRDALAVAWRLAVAARSRSGTRPRGSRRPTPSGTADSRKRRSPS